jgi:hypothetical protein
MFFFEFSPGGNESPPEYIPKLPMRLFSLYKIGSNEQNTRGLQRGEEKENTHTPTKHKNGEKERPPRKSLGDG